MISLIRFNARSSEIDKSSFIKSRYNINHSKLSSFVESIARRKKLLEIYNDLEI